MSTWAQSIDQPLASQSRAGTGGQHSIAESLALHLLPGAFILVVFILAAPFLLRAGLPSMFAMLAGATLGLGFQLAHLLLQGRQRDGTLSLQSIVLYGEPMPLWQYFVLVPAFAIVAFLVNGITAPLGSLLLAQFPLLPEWFEVRSVAQLEYYSRPILAALFGMTLLVNGIAAPIIEELYFRGYLMPRLSRYGRWTPVIETALFTLYHFWQPYFWVTQFLSMLPVVISVSWKRNVKLGILTHATLNIVGAILTFGLLLG